MTEKNQTMQVEEEKKPRNYSLERGFYSHVIAK